MKTESNIRPTAVCEFFHGKKNFLVFNDLDSIKEFEREGEIMYSYQTYQMETSATEEYVMENVNTLFSLAKQFEYDRLAQEIREKRNRLLDESDKYMALDRLDLDTSSAIRFLASLANIFKNNYATYRQALRDITKQEGFPYDVVFPEKPE